LNSDDPPFRSFAQYLARWKTNRRFCESIDSAFVDWQITVIFYTALHAINTGAAHLGLKPTTHVGRNEMVKFNEAFAPVRTQYLRLYRLARFTRYDPDPEQWLPKQYLTVQVVVDQVLKPIENQVEALVGKGLNLPLIRMKV
jgi:hypothetical protein